MIATRLVERTLDRLSGLDTLADSLQGAIGQALTRGGPAARAIKDALNGVWFEHPLHPALSDLPIGAWTCATLLDLAGSRDSRLAGAADLLVGAGCAGGVAAAASGLADWQDTYGAERRTGLAHALLNSTALVLMLFSLKCRRRGSRTAGIGLSLLGSGTALLAAYLGGDLVFKFGTQVNHAAWIESPEDWTTAIADSAVAEGQLVRAMAGATPVLLVRKDGRLHAMCAVCSHAGGPLDEGTLTDNAVICPWHGSYFDLDDGHPFHGPASINQPVYETRITDGNIQVRRAPAR